MDREFLSTRCYFIENDNVSHVSVTGSTGKIRKFLKIGKLSAIRIPGVRKQITFSGRDLSCNNICFNGIWDDGITSNEESLYPNADQYGDIFRLFSSLKLSPGVYIDISGATEKNQKKTVKETVERIQEFLNISEINDLVLYWKRGSFELINSSGTDNATFMETYADAYAILKNFSKSIRVGFRAEMNSVLRAMDIFEENLILCKNHGCEPDFVTISINPMSDGICPRRSPQVKHAMHIIHDSGARVKSLYVVNTEYVSAPDRVCGKFEVSQSFSDISPGSDHMISQMIKLLLSCA
jgi:hypothetical protein